jgi:hypothetical protein
MGWEALRPYPTLAAAMLGSGKRANKIGYRAIFAQAHDRALGILPLEGIGDNIVSSRKLLLQRQPEWNETGLHVLAANLSNPKVCKMRWVHGTGENRTGGVGVIVGRVLWPVVASSGMEAVLGWSALT